MSSQKTQVQYDQGRILVLDKKTANWVVVATLPHQTVTKISPDILALKVMRLIMDLENN